MRLLAPFETISGDVRVALRGLMKNPGFLAVVVLSLALGIAANSTIFSVLDTLLYRPLPYPQPQKLVVIWQKEAAHPGPHHTSANRRIDRLAAAESRL